MSGKRKAAQKTSTTALSAQKNEMSSLVRIRPRRAEARVAPMMMAAAERIDELSFSKSLLNIITV